MAALADDPGERARASEVTARFVSDQVVLITYTAERAARSAARCGWAATTAGARSLRSSLWVGGDDGWRVLFHQGTPV